MTQDLTGSRGNQDVAAIPALPLGFLARRALVALGLDPELQAWGGEAGVEPDHSADSQSPRI